MIDEYYTWKIFGYHSDELSYGSNKPIVAVCDRCYKHRRLSFREYRDFCKSCMQIGRKHTEETKLEMSINRSGKCIGNEHYMFGKHLPEETSKKMSDVRKGKHMGEYNPNWRGGTSFEPYCEKFNDNFKELIRNNFGRMCFMCLAAEEDNGQKLCVHHVSYDKDCMCNGEECEFVPLCKKCHSTTNGGRDLWEKLIINVLQYEGWI